MNVSKSVLMRGAQHIFLRILPESTVNVYILQIQHLMTEKWKSFFKMKYTFKESSSAVIYFFLPSFLMRVTLNGHS